jgi:hypothetical protein
MASTAVSKYRTSVKISTAAGAAKTLTAITAASSAVCTSSAHGLTAGMVVVFASVSGMTEINGNVGLITAADTNTFTVNINSAAYTAYTSGGTATAQTMTLIENVLDFQRNGDEAETIDSTNLQSVKKEYIIGLSGEGSVTIPVDVDYSGPGQAAVRAKVGVDTAVAISVTRSDGKIQTLPVKFTNFSESFSDKHGGSFSGKVTGPVGWYA